MTLIGNVRKLNLYFFMKTAFALLHDSLAQTGKPMQEQTFLGCLLLARHFPPSPQTDAPALIATLPPSIEKCMSVLFRVPVW